MHKKISFFLLSGILLLISLSFLIISCKPLDKYYGKNIKLALYDAIIVPGVPFMNGAWDTIMKGRVLWSVYLYRQGFAKNVVYYGSSVYSPFIEGQIMAMYAEKLDVKQENIFIEPRAEHSTENVYYDYRVAEKQGFKTVALATDRFQSRTLLAYLRKLKRKINADIKCLPMQYDIVKTMPQENFPIDSMQAHVDDFKSLYERESFWKRFRGTMGKHINYKEGKSENKNK